MVERRMRLSIFAVVSFWFNAWVNAELPDLKSLSNQHFSEEDIKAFETLDKQWKTGTIKG